MLIVYDENTISSVKDQFILQMEAHGLTDKKGVYKAIGHIRKDDAKGITVGSYWDDYDGSKKAGSTFRYWGAIDEICDELKEGRMYRV